MPEKKNICLTINSLSPGGAEKQCLLLAKALKPYHNPFVDRSRRIEPYIPGTQSYKKSVRVYQLSKKKKI